jgi:hypothetical protein
VKPDAARFLEVAAAHVALRTGPALGSGYEQSTMMVLAAMLICMREEFDRAAARRVEENRELRRIFGAAVGVVEEPTLRAALERAAGRGDESLAVPDLEESNATLRALLIDLHVYVERNPSSETRQIEEEIWRELVASTERRRLSLGAF